MLMEFRTAISKMTEEDLIIRGRKHSEMVGNWSFSKTIFLLLSGKEPDGKEERLFDAMLTLVIDHGMGTASSMASRFVASTGNPLNASVAAGVLALGDRHGGAIDQAMRMLQEVKESGIAADAFVEQALSEKRTLYGYGHKVYKEHDPRTTQLARLCRSIQFDADFLQLGLTIEKELEKRKGKKLVFNVDGAIAALLLEMGFPPEMGKGFFLIARTPGLVAQAMEEQEREPPVRRVDEEAILYDGA